MEIDTDLIGLYLTELVLFVAFVLTALFLLQVVGIKLLLN